LQYILSCGGMDAAAIIIPKSQTDIAHNVPAVYDVFAGPIKETAGFQGLQKCGWS
jgi:hypothetical protein